MKIFQLLNPLSLALLMGIFWSQGSFAQTGGEDELSYRDQVQIMYVAYYGRPGDAGGLDFWAGKLEEVNGSLMEIINEFGTSMEFQDRFGDLDDEELVDNIFLQLFGRDADSGGLNFYVNALREGRFTLASLALNVADGTNEKPEGRDNTVKTNKLRAANAFSEAYVEAGADYGEFQIDDAKLWLGEVDSTEASVTAALDRLPDLLEMFSGGIVPGPQIYNDNVFVLPVAENPAALWTDSGKNPPLEDYAARFYEHFSDEFDFLIFFPNVDPHRLEPGSIDGAFYQRVKNDVRGIGLPSVSHNSSYGSAGKLQGVIFHSYDDPSSFRGVLLHELMHRWGNFVVPITSFPGGPHWGFCSSGGYLDGYDISNMIDLGAGKFSAPNPFYFRSSEQYSPIELYLAGFIAPEEVPDFQTAEDGEWLLDERGYPVEDDNGYRVFTASGFKTHRIEDIIAEHGPRVPDHSQAQKDFRAAVILLVSEDYPATRERLERLSGDVSWFSHAGMDEFGPPVTNFHEATGGWGTITMTGLSQFQSRARAKRLMPGSFGTPPLPIVDLRE